MLILNDNFYSLCFIFYNLDDNVCLTSNLYFWLPRLVRCFCQKLSGLMMCAVWMAFAKYSWRTFRIGLTVVQADPEPPRISIITVNPSSRTSSLKIKYESIINILLRLFNCIYRRRYKAWNLINSESKNVLWTFYMKLCWDGPFEEKF